MKQYVSRKRPMKLIVRRVELQSITTNSIKPLEYPVPNPTALKNNQSQAAAD
jgi:hypothetical protein